MKKYSKPEIKSVSTSISRIGLKSAQCSGCSTHRTPVIEDRK